MSLRFLFDTDHLTLFEFAHPVIVQRYAVQPPGSVGVSAVSVEEALRGRLVPLARARTGAARIQAYSRLTNTVVLVATLPSVSFDQDAEDQFQQLLSLKVRIGVPDLKIAAVALARNLTLLTRNRHDFVRIPNLLFEDWTI